MRAARRWFCSSLLTVTLWFVRFTLALYACVWVCVCELYFEIEKYSLLATAQCLSWTCKTNNHASENTLSKTKTNAILVGSIQFFYPILIRIATDFDAMTICAFFTLLLLFIRLGLVCDCLFSLSLSPHIYLCMNVMCVLHTENIAPWMLLSAHLLKT